MNFLKLIYLCPSPSVSSMYFLPNCNLSSSTNTPSVTSGLLISKSLASFRMSQLGLSVMSVSAHQPFLWKHLAPGPRLQPYLFCVPFQSLWPASHQALSSCCPPGPMLGVGGMEMNCGKVPALATLWSRKQAHGRVVHVVGWVIEYMIRYSIKDFKGQ